MSHCFQRSAVALLLGGLYAVSAPRVALADDAKAACASSYEQSQELRASGKLKDAQEKLVVCAQEVCPAFVRTDCVQWLAEVQHDLPTVVIAAKDQNGQDTVAVTVTIDGEVVAKELDGKALPLDPGVHKLKFELAGADPIEQQVVVRQGQKDREIAVSFAKAPAEAPDSASPYGADNPADADQGSPKPGKLRPVAFVAGGVGAAGIIGFAVFGALGKGGRSDLDSSGCKPNCSQDKVDAIKSKYLIADISLGVGIAGLGTGVALFFLSQPKKPAQEQTSRAVKFDVHAAPGMTFATMSGRF